MSTPYTWAIVVFRDCWEATQVAIEDVLAQTAPARVLAISNGSEGEARDALRRFVRGDDRVLSWDFSPPLLSLAAVWNRGLDFCWGLGAEEAWVLNNDIRLHKKSLEALRQARAFTGGLFTSAVGRRPEEWNPEDESWLPVNLGQRGGPDFSCYLISREGHEKYRFDEGFTPCYTEDVDAARRYQLGGDGARIFSVNVPYCHFASGTLKAMNPEARARTEAAIEKGARAHYLKKWGGPVGAEKFLVPFGRPLPEGWIPCPQGCVTTPELERHRCGGRAAASDEPLDDASHRPIPSSTGVD